MAAYETDLSRSYGRVVGNGEAKAKVSLGVAIVALTTGMLDNANDDVGLFNVAKNAVVTGCTLSVTDMDDATALVIDVGISGTENLFIDGATTGQAGGITSALARAGHLYKFTSQTQVRAYIKTAAGTPAAGTLKFELEGWIDEGFSTTALVAS
jgi:hypothetical protein